MTNSIASSLDDITRKNGNQSALMSKMEQTEANVKKQKLEFMNLLTTQLKNQDPLSPTDVDTITSQMYAMNGLEQQLETNKLLNRLVSVSQDQILSAIAGNIGKYAVFNGNATELKDSKATFNYEVDHNYSSVEIEVKDRFNNIVYKGEVPKSVGDNAFIWDGVNNFGKTVNDGNYKFSVTGISHDNDRKYLKTSSTGVIEGVLSQGSDYKYIVGGQEIFPEFIIKYQIPPKDDIMIPNTINKDLMDQANSKASDILQSMQKEMFS